MSNVQITRVPGEPAPSAAPSVSVSSVRQSVEQAILTCAPAATEKGLAIFHQLADFVLLETTAYPTLFESLLVALLQRAIHSAAPNQDGQGFLELTVDKTEAQLEVSIATVAAGPLYLFEQSPEKSSLDCRDLVAQLGASLTVDTEAAFGTRYWLRCPCTKQFAGPPLPSTPSTVPLSKVPPVPPSALDQPLSKLGLSILLAEDNPINQKVAVRMLAKLGVSPDVVANGHKVLDRTAEKEYDVILMDMQMPEMDGLEASRQIRARNANQPRIIALTANNHKQAVEDCTAAGMDDFITKPITLQALEQALRRAQSGNRNR